MVEVTVCKQERSKRIWRQPKPAHDPGDLEAFADEPCVDEHATSVIYKKMTAAYDPAYRVKSLELSFHDLPRRDGEIRSRDCSSERY